MFNTTVIGQKKLNTSEGEYLTFRTKPRMFSITCEQNVVKSIALEIFQLIFF